MAEENQVTKEPQQVQQEPQQITTKDPKKVEVGKRLAAINRKKREVKKRDEAQNGGVSQYYRVGVVLAVGVIGGLGYYIYQLPSKESTEKSGLQTHNKMIPLRLTSLRWIKSLLYYKNGQEEYSK